MADYVAKEDLYIGFTKARNKGDSVSEDQVKQFGWSDHVEKQTAKKTTTEEKKTEDK